MSQGFSVGRLLAKQKLAKTLRKALEATAAAEAAEPREEGHPDPVFTRCQFTKIEIDDSLSAATVFWVLHKSKGEELDLAGLDARREEIGRRAAASLARPLALSWQQESFVRKEVREWTQSIVIALALTLVIRTFVVQAFKIPSGSMRPTLIEGDKLFVNKYLYRFEPPARGDIVVFKFPGDKKKDFIKRLVAMGGETVEIRDGKILVNGKPVEEPSLRKYYYYNHEEYGGTGVAIKVPEKSYYVLGDNSANSTDSRYWGFVPEKNMIGKAFFRWWPPRRIGKVE